MTGETVGARIEPVWLESDVAFAIHDRQLAEHGGGTGVRDTGALESALARPVNRWVYGEDDLCALAAAYAFGVARNHPFADGNKRAAFLATGLCLALNGWRLTASQADATVAVMTLAAGELEESAFAAWLRSHIAPRSR